jgi:hypothetical protein
MLNIQIKLSMSHGGYTIYSYGLQRAYCAVQKKKKNKDHVYMLLLN